ncbi:hypothetical protein A9Q81_02175 [Gammaproteobacteria bacterium 42_54_T18]|nr:hypothetical protein A9Q81_02175 [Gammaproteobacteria bacterium 42_54_T18]
MTTKIWATKQEINQQTKQKGVTLVELMVALAISSFLMLGIFQIYFSSRLTDNMGSALARIQETGRVALDIMTKDIRLAGYQGCLDPKQGDLIVSAVNSPTASLADSGVRGFTVAPDWANGTEFTSADIASGGSSGRSALKGTSVIAVQRAAPVAARVTAVSATTLTLAANALDINKNDLFVVASCNEGHLDRASDVSSGNGETQITLSSDLGVQYASADAPGFVMRFLSTVYFVADTNRVNSAGNAVYALYRQRDTSSGFVVEELVEGVENMQVLYGQRLSTGNVRYVPADTADLNMGSVESVRIGVLVASTQNVQQGNDELSYLLPGITVDHGDDTGINHLSDRRIRRTFVTTVNIRNREI